MMIALVYFHTYFQTNVCSERNESTLKETLSFIVFFRKHVVINVFFCIGILKLNLSNQEI